MPQNDLIAIDRIVRESLTDYVDEVFAGKFFGKEHDHVNLFALGHLLTRCTAAGPLRHPTQIGLGVGVPQPQSVGENAAARKDLVIWPEPRMTCWDSAWKPGCHPIALLEWKVRRPGGAFHGHNHDREWLSAYARSQPGFVGYSVAVDFEARKFRLWVERFSGTETTVPWLHL